MLICERFNKFLNSGSIMFLLSNINKLIFGVMDDFWFVWEVFELSGKLRKRIDFFGFYGMIVVGVRFFFGISEILMFILVWYYFY